MFLPHSSGLERMSIFHQLVNAYKLTNPIRSLELAKKSFELSQEQEDEEIIMESNYHLGLAYHFNGDYDSSIRYSLPAIEKLIQLGIYEKYIPYASIVILSYFYSGNFDLAIKYVTNDKVLSELEYFQSAIPRFDLYIRIGWVYKLAGNYHKAKLYFLKCVEIENESEIIPPAHRCLNGLHLSDCYTGIQKFDSALYYAKKANHLQEKYSFNAIPAALDCIAQAYEGMEKMDSAIYYYKNSIKLTNQIGAVMQHGESCWSLGRIYYQQGNTEYAIELFHKMIQDGKWIADNQRFFIDSITNYDYWYSSEQIVNPFYIKTGYNYMIIGYQLLSKIYKVNGQTEKAFESLSNYLDVKNKLDKIDKQDAVMAVNVKFEVDQKNQRISLLEQQNELQHYRIRQNRFYLLGLGGLIIIMGLFVLLFIRQNKLKTEQEKTALQQKLLRSQMNPHFIFNSLSSIQNSIINEEPKKASKYLARFSKLVRSILDSTVEEFIPMEQEISTIENYLELQKIRFPDKFDFTIEVDEQLDTESVQIPPMLTQPFIENSIEHGIKHRNSRGNIKVRFLKKESSLVVEVEDDGVGREKAKEILVEQNINHKSIATVITQERIRILNKKLKSKISMDIIDLVDEKGVPSGTKVVFEI
jgi:tetratricopeptide (TPR) repeat protein